MSGNRILWGQITLVLAVVLATTWTATQWTAWRLGFQPQLGQPWFELAQGAPVYYPPAFFWWWYAYDAYAPSVFIEGGFIAASGGFIAVALAITLSILRAREVYARAAKLPGIEVTGTDMHIGSQITDLSKMETAFRILADFVQTLRADGHNIEHIDFGGGLGIPYHADREAPPLPSAYAAMVKRVTHNLGCTLMFEPGRMIVGNAGILVARVIYVKPGDAKNFVIIDAAMNDLIRPTLYEAHHDILPVREAAPGDSTITADVVGPVCETGDYLALDRSLPEPKPGDLLAIMTAGAYGAVQSGSYNTRPLVPEVLVKDDQYAVVRPRIEVDELIAMDRQAPWL
jgi:diaminopimelate decarboxylase